MITEPVKLLFCAVPVWLIVKSTLVAPVILIANGYMLFAALYGSSIVTAEVILIVGGISARLID